MFRTQILAAVCGLLAAVVLTGGARAAEPLNVSVDGNVFRADLEVPGGYSAELTVTFEDVVGLSAESLNVSASAVNPLDASLLARLGSTVSGIPVAFPMLVEIEPDPSKGLTFSGVVKVELYTHDLEFVANSPFRLYSAPLGGAFRDVTTSHSAGSYRSGGTKGNFSEFMIVIDSRSPAASAGDKLQSLRSLLDGYVNSLDTDIYSELSGLLSGAESAYASGALVAAVSYTEAFAEAVEDHGSAIPNVWSAAASLENVAGKLRAAAGTLRFSLILAINNA